eukprot:2987491-Lingulodinium_polyedra.AAC.1
MPASSGRNNCAAASQARRCSTRPNALAALYITSRDDAPQSRARQAIASCTRMADSRRLPSKQ